MGGAPTPPILSGEGPPEQNVICIADLREAVPKRYPKKRRFNLRKVKIESSLAVGALAASDVTSSALTATSANKYRVTSVKCSYMIADLPALADGGYQFGIAHSSYTAAQIEEAIEATGAIDIGNLVSQEQANRRVREIGTIGGSQGTAVGGEILYNEGRPVKTKLNWNIGIGDTLVMYVRNGSSVIYTTGALLKSKGEMWVTP